MTLSKPHCIVIGAGFTGCAIAYDLSLRGFSTTVVERGEIASGTSGRTHGLLHSGARYCVDDPEAATECIAENRILRQITTQCIEFNGGMFIALSEDDLEYCESFERGAQNCQIPIEKLNRQEVLYLEPRINPDVILAYTVPDGAFDPLRLALAFAASARLRGACFLTFQEVEAMSLDGNGNVTGVKIWDRRTNTKKTLYGDIVINATGAWAGSLASMANARVSVTPTPGVMVAYDQRLTQRVLNRLNKPGDGDIIIPQRRMMVIGTTSFEVTDVDYIPVTPEQVTKMHHCAELLIPDIKKTNMRGAYMSARPLIGSTLQGRSISRTFKCYDHKENEGIEGLVTITGGKATTCRVMAEKTVDLVCQKLGLKIPCTTGELPLASYRNFYK